MSKKKSDDLYSISGAAKKLERDRRTIEKGIEGLKPDFVTGTVRKWRLSRIVQGIDENTLAPVTKSKNAKNELRGSGLAYERARLARAQAEAVEHKNRIASGAFVPVQIVAEVFETANTVVRERMLGVPTCASVITSLVNPTTEEVHEIIRREIYAGLEELADPEYFQKAGEAINPLAAEPDEGGGAHE
jgi:phage terminase Nu1 subunit (DNA packaging protein)